MSDRIALITGANTGIGFEVVKQLGKLGNYVVYLGARSNEKGKEAEQKLASEGIQNVHFIYLDPTNVQSIAEAAKHVESKHGRLDVLVNNAGTGGFGPKSQQATTVDIPLLREVFEINFFGLVEVTKAFAPLLKKSSLPIVVNVSTDMASNTLQSKPDSYLHMAAYNPSKAAANSYTIALAHELKNGKVNSVTPGYTSTALNAFSGPKTAADAASLIVKFATLDKDGPTSKFFDDKGELPW